MTSESRCLINVSSRRSSSVLIPRRDVAVVRIDATGLPTVAFADSDKLEVGEFVLAVGNPFGLTQTVTLGIVSALDEPPGLLNMKTSFRLTRRLILAIQAVHW